MLLGGDLYACLLRAGVLLGSGPGEPATINTVFSWVINGPVDIRTPSVVHAFLTTVDSDSLEFTLKRFWQLEEVPEKTFANPSGAQCEEFPRNCSATVFSPGKSVNSEPRSSKGLCRVHAGLFGSGSYVVGATRDGHHSAKLL
jgi:hypothetical protein